MIKARNKGKILIRIFKWILILAIILILGFLMYVPHMIMSGMIDKHADFKDIKRAEDFDLTVKEFYVTTEDELSIHAREVVVLEPRAVVVYISGIHNPSVTEFYGHAKLMKENSYASILFDIRAHGKSDGDLISLGYKEVLDVKAIVNYINHQEKYKDLPIILHGLSMGGATAINATGEISDIDAVISMSAYASWEDVFADNMRQMELPEAYIAIQRPFVKLYSLYRFGLSTYNISPKQEIKKLGDRPALIIHSKDDSEVGFNSYEKIIANAPKHVKKYVIDGDHHMVLESYDVFLKPELDKEYTSRVLSLIEETIEINSK